MSVNSKMTAIADEIRELSGTTGAMGLGAMATNVGDANSEINSQTALLVQAVAVLEGKAAGGGDTSIEDGLITGKIAGEYNNDRVEYIRNYVFANCGELISVSFPAATTIGASAFVRCASLTTVSFPVATIIENGAFNYCSKLTTVSFPAVTTIGTSAFRDCYSLTTASFPATTTIGEDTFYNCYSLTTASFPAVTTISDSAFYGCTGLTTASFPAAATIGASAFAYCSKLTTVSFPAVTTISDSAFYNCYSLTTASFPAVTTIGSGAFRYCYGLTTASFPAAATIGASAFAYCSGLTTASFPSATTIGSNAFGSCYSLTTASFPVKMINDYAFYKCSNLTTLQLYSNKVCVLNNKNAFNGTPYSSALYNGTPVIYVPNVLLSSYKTATNWAYYSSYFVGVDVELPPVEIETITFIISVGGDETSYEAEEGMTWEEWVDSDYNIDGYLNSGYNIQTSDGGGQIMDSTYMSVTPDMLIVAHEVYVA